MHMAFDEEKMDQLLERYFQGETSLEEESWIRSQCQRRDLPEQYHAYRSWFSVVGEEAHRSLDDSFETELLERINRQQREATVRTLIRKPWQVAAAVVLALGLATWIWSGDIRSQWTSSSDQIDWSKYEPDTPEEAAQIYRKALLRVSSEMNTGAAKAANKLETLEEIGAFFK